MSTSKTAVVILNWNGRNFLQQFLPIVISKSPKAKIYVADNASTDDSVEFLNNNYPQVNVIRNNVNAGFAGGYNLALKKIDTDYYILLNSDVEVTDNWIEPVIEFMDANPEVAACQPKILDFANREKFEYAGASGGFIDYLGYPFCRGRIFDEIEFDIGQYNDAVNVFWATGACMFIRSKLFHKLNGFDESFFAHMEEIDLCWRLINRGYLNAVVPSSIVYHVGGGTLQKTNPRKTYLNFRNSLIAYTKNYAGNLLFLKLYLRLLLDGVAAVKFLFEGKFREIAAIVKAHWSFFLCFFRILKLRNLEKQEWRPGYSNNLILNKSIVRLHFLKAVKKYSDIK